MSILEAAIKTGAIQTANNLRIASLAIATYDYLWTLPAEYRFYRTWYRGNFRLSTSLVLFVLIRYSSITVLTLSNVGFFSTGFTAASCNRYYMLPPIFKVPQTMTSQAILGIRAYSISGRNRYPAAVLLSGYVVASTLQWFTNLYHRRAVFHDGSCTGASTNPRAFISVWLFYLVAMLYDLLTLAISMGYLLKYRPQSPYLSRLMKMMIYDGLGYFVALTAANTLNVILYRAGNTTIQSAGVSVGNTITWIMSQRILINLRDASPDQPRSWNATHRYHHSNRNMNDMLRAVSRKGSLDPGPSAPGTGDSRADPESNELVQVHVERSIVIDADAFDKAPRDELYSTPEVKWNQGLA